IADPKSSQQKLSLARMGDDPERFSFLTAKAAAACNVIMGLSFMSTCTIEEVASSCIAVRFFQLYILNRRDISALMVKRAETNGFKAILLTVDTPRLGRREADIKNKMIAPQLKNFEGLMSTEIDDASEIANFTDGSKLASLAPQNAIILFHGMCKSITSTSLILL
ncbi:peroxisomal (S)-2-hydroxy-acid oxidase GLO4-like protein, partial [Tanacetum coccineum]